MSTTDNIFPSVTYTIDFDANKIPTSNSTLANLIELSTWFPQLNAANNVNKKQGESFTLYGSEATYFLRLLGKLGGISKRDVNILDGRTTKTGATVLDINVVAPITITSTSGFSCQAGFKNRLFGTQGVAVDGAGTFNTVKYSPVDDKIYAAGFSGAEAMIARFNTDGTLDTTWGTTGVVTTDINGSDDDWYDIVVQADGKVVAVGSTDNGGDIEAVIGRYDTDGTLDSNFGTAGLTEFAVSANDEVLRAVALQSDGSIIATGNTGAAAAENVLTVRVTSDGTPDANYGTAGVFAFSIDIAGDFGTGIAYQGSTNRIVVAGYTDSAGADNVFVAGILIDGSGLDTGSFGTLGITETVIGNESQANDLVLDASDNLVVVGWSNDGADITPVILRYDPNGTIDGSPVLVANSDAVYNSVEIQPDGNFVAAGTNSTNSSIVVGRHTTAALALDADFANGGINEIYIGASAAGNGIAVRGSDLAIAVAGVQNGTAMVVELCGQTV